MGAKQGKPQGPPSRPEWRGYPIWAWVLIIIAFLGALITAGILVGLGGVALNRAVKDDRGRNIADYNAAVSDWKGANRAPFAAASFRVAGPAAPAGVDVPTVVDRSDTDRLRAGDSDPSINTDYIAARKRALASALLPTGASLSITPTGACTDPASCTISFAAGAAALYSNLVLRAYRFDEVPKSSLTWEERVQTGKSGGYSATRDCKDGGDTGEHSCIVLCASQGDGYEWRQAIGRCVRSQSLAGVCVRVEPRGPSAFAAASPPACFRDTVELWERVEELSPSSVTLSPSAPIEVRSSADPFLLAFKQTDGKLNYGLTSGEYARYGGIMVGVGAACFFLGIGIGIAMIFMYRHPKRMTASTGNVLHDGAAMDI